MMNLDRNGKKLKRNSQICEKYLSLNYLEIFKRFNGDNMQVVEPNLTWNDQILSFNGCYKVFGSLVN
jgi:hypothetical protein